MTRFRFLSTLAVLALAASACDASGITQARGADPHATGPARSLSSLEVSISGLSHIEPGAYTCPYYASVWGGVGPYQYSWWTTGGGSGSGYDEWWHGGGTGNFTVHVLVTDANNAQAQDSFPVQVSSMGITCPY